MALSAGVELPLAAVRDQLTAAIDLIIQVARVADGSRRVVALSEVLDAPAGGHRVRALADPAGLHDLPARPPRSPGTAAPDPGWCR
jgi:Flp pilus assembly CpaF family ATPase